MPTGKVPLEICHKILSQAKIGTLLQPHESATIFLILDSLEGGEEGTLTGPGIDETISISLPEEGLDVDQGASADEF